MDTLIGQEAARTSIQTALDAGRMHHAWIFAGPHGVGKCTCAIALAKRLLCSTDLMGQPDSACCHAIDQGLHPDFHLIYKELALYAQTPQLRTRKLLNLPLDLLRELMIGGQTADGKRYEAKAFKTATKAKGKVFIIDEAELLDLNAQNALLKTLEEPPVATYIFLITSRPQRLLPTIRSRCQLVRFSPLNDQAMMTWMQRHHSDLNDEDQKQALLDLAGGSPGRAQVALEYKMTAWPDELAGGLEALQEGGFPVPLGGIMSSLVDDFAKAWVKDHENASKDAANKLGAAYLLGMLADLARRKLAQRAKAGQPVDRDLAVIKAISDAEANLDASVNMKHTFENLVAQWAAADCHKAAMA